VLLGSITPRLWTPELRELDPTTSYGFDLIDFAELIGLPLDPWEQWAAIHLGELLADGRPRFRQVLVLVARQNGKTTLAKVLILYWQFVDQVPLILATSTVREYARQVWADVCEMATTHPVLSGDLGPDPIRKSNGQEALITAAGSTYSFAAANRRAGRSLTVHRALLDELREHRQFDAFNAVANAMNAVRDAQLVAISNQGDDQSVVLDALRLPALQYIETGSGDPRLGLLEWSAPDGADPEDPAAIAAANPNLGHRIDLDALVGAGARAKLAGGEELTGHRTEVLCQRVAVLDPAIEPAAWVEGATTAPTDLAQHRLKVALCFDVSLNGMSATALVAAVIDGKVHVEVAGAWTGIGCTRALRTELPGLVDRIRPRRVGWLPNGPAAVVAADIAERKGQRGWTPRGTTVQEIRTELPATCMGLSDLVLVGELVHPDDPYLNGQVASAGKLWHGDTWTFTRKGGRSVEAVYALAGAAHLARTLPPPPPPLQVVRV
jgi:hypothetical protein